MPLEHLDQWREDLKRKDTTRKKNYISFFNRKKKKLFLIPLLVKSVQCIPTPPRSFSSLRAKNVYEVRNLAYTHTNQHIPGCPISPNGLYKYITQKRRNTKLLIRTWGSASKPITISEVTLCQALQISAQLLGLP